MVAAALEDRRGDRVDLRATSPCDIVLHGAAHRVLRGRTHALWVQGAWDRCKSLALHYREKAGEPRIYENFEALARTS